MAYDWSTVEIFFAKPENADRLAGKLTKWQSNSSKNYVNFSFSQQNNYSGYYRLRVVQDPEGIHWLDIYFETKGQDESLQDVICPKLIRIPNRDFNLKEWDTNKHISRKLVPRDKNKIGNLEWIIDTMILIADHLQEIEQDVFLEKKKQPESSPASKPTKEPKTSRRLKREDEFEFGFCQDFDNRIIPAPGVSKPQFDDFTKFQLTGHDKQKKPISRFASWAIWKEPGTKDCNDRSNLEFICINDSLKELRPNLIFVGENISGKLCGDWINFHRQNDSANNRLRYVINNSCFRGAYLTDFIKGYVNPKGEKVLTYFEHNTEELEKHKDNFIAELKEVTGLSQAASPIIIVLLGTCTKNLFKLAFKRKTLDGCAKTIAQTLKRNIVIAERYHYSYVISPEQYRDYFSSLKEKIEAHSIQNMN